ncbi:hypothetical protein IV203_022479 [Nitzschia inconspicua]|uniref:DUF6824 domain-containing protein n=1 Tax=Nitzschia inconspicua TaxID=303405 RepID=A0A9K3P8F3_9STRA|nr:hypothetical protein IV203_022738 [Nitzschia inconspicua]KAG7344471.1 hypothetical protein IV203_022479 [Nitzschia inconspicua]
MSGYWSIPESVAAESKDWNDANIDQVIVDVSHVDPSQVDALLAKELKQLSFSERERAYEEIHGVHDGGKVVKGGKILLPSEEEATRIRQVLQQMQTELESIKKKSAYEEAVTMKSPLVADIDFQTKFVYAENFDAPKAAKRMIDYLEMAKQLFGVQALHRSVQFADLSPNALEILHQGSLQIPQLRDQSHRRIQVLLADCGMSYPLKDRLQVAFYMNSCLAEDQESIRLGFVFIMFLYHLSFGDIEHNRGITNVLNSSPIRMSALHICSPGTPSSKAAKSTALLMMGARNRLRVRLHVGSPTDCLHSLKTFGIPAECLPPIPEMGTTDTLRKHLKWCLMRQTKEELLKRAGNIPLAIVECPRQEDCLFGKGQAITKHPGNVGMRRLVASKLDRYQVAAFKDKSRLAWEVVHEVKECGGRFLKEQFNGLFVEVNDETCRKKVSIAFRDLAKKGRQYNENSEEQQEARKHKLGFSVLEQDMETAQDDEFQLFPQQKLECDTSSFLNLSGNSRKRHKGIYLNEFCG